MKTIPILLAAGHGGTDTGALSPDGRHAERDEAIRITDAVADILRGHGMVVTVAPHGEDTHETVAWVNRRYAWGECWAMEIHRDCAPKVKEPAASLRCGIYHGDSALSTNVAWAWNRAAISADADLSSWVRNQKESRHRRLQWIAAPAPLSHILELGFMHGRHDLGHLLRLAAIAATGIIAAAPLIPLKK